MPLINTKINKESEKFISNYEYHKNLSSELSDKIKKIRKMGDLDKVEKHRSRGKLTARERIDRLRIKKLSF